MDSLLSFFPPFQQFNESNLDANGEEFIRIIEDPYVIVSVIFYSWIIVNVSRGCAEVVFEKDWSLLEYWNANKYFSIHTEDYQLLVFFSMCLSLTFLLSNLEMIQSLGIFHIAFYSCTLFQWTFSLTASSSLKPVEWDLYNVSKPKFRLYVLIGLALFVMEGVELCVFLEDSDPEHPFIGQLLFTVSLVLPVYFFFQAIRLFAATKLFVLKENEVVSVMIRHETGHKFEHWEVE